MTQAGEHVAAERAATGAAERYSLLLSGQASNTELAEIATWRAADPANEAAWTRVSAAWLSSGMAADDPAIRTMRGAALNRGAQRSTPRWRTWQPLALAASLALVLGTTLWAGSQGWLPGSGPGGSEAPADTARWSPEIQTRTGQIRPVQLSDGSVVTVNTDSKLRTAISKTGRRVELSRGEAYFKVARDPARPFSVTAGTITVTALGTEFAVRRTDDGIIVTLAHGSVRVTDANRPEQIVMTPGSQLRADAAGFHRIAIDAARATHWTTGSLDFLQAPLGQAVAEMNRYAPQQILLKQDALARQPVTGTFPAGEQDRFVDMLVATGKVRVSRRTASTIEISAP